MDIMRHKDSVDAIVKTGKAIMNSKSPEEKEILKVNFSICNLKLRTFYSISMCANVKDLLGFQSGQDSDALGEVRYRESAELRALSAAGASPVSRWSVLGDLRGDVAVATGNLEHLQPAASTCH